MRLSNHEIKTIQTCTKEIFGNCKIILFGSRVDISQKGGDIDLLLEPLKYKTDWYIKKINLLVKLKQILGDQKIDIIVSLKNDKRGIVQTAINEGIVL
ncbi:MAG: nucleotidyltransferase domain-containing protein [Salinivirgaceae bacterium]|jgi:predicted nucleotidyltransferase|nr:nucleotidyltransferase domain-containing protein [Salinivirgaceae bacterium]